MAEFPACRSNVTVPNNARAWRERVIHSGTIKSSTGTFDTISLELVNLVPRLLPAQHHGHYYNQNEGISMESPLDPLFANFFPSHHEKNWLEIALLTLNLYIIDAI